MKKNARSLPKTVRFQGDEVAVVAAESEEIAQDALRLIDVAYAPLDFVLDFETALQPAVPLIDEGGNQKDEPKVYERGDVLRGFAEAAVVIDQIYTTQTQVHNSLEPHGCTAFWQGDQLTIWESTQGIFEVREQVAQKLEIAGTSCACDQRTHGRWLWQQADCLEQTVIAALLSRQTGRPVQFMLDREAENLAAGSRGKTWQRLRPGAKRDGTLTALAVEIRIANGAYSVGGEGADVSGLYQRLIIAPTCAPNKWLSI